MSQIVEAFVIFRDEIYPDGGGSAMCDIHQAFGSLDGSTRHNCLGCNLADSTMWIHNCLQNALTTDHSSREEFYFDYLIKLYLLVERVVLFDIIGLPLEYRGRHFSTRRGSQVGQFHKASKELSSLFTPKIFMADDKDAPLAFDPTKFGVVIDQEFVLECAWTDNNQACTSCSPIKLASQCSSQTLSL